MIYVYRRASSSSARLLAEALNGRRLRDLSRVRIRPDDKIVMWGEHAQVPAQALNNVPVRNKLTEVETLRSRGVPTVEISRTRPQAREIPVGEYEVIGRRINQDQARQMIQELTEYTNRRPTRQEVTGWLPRVSNHIGGLDLLAPPAQPDYFVKKVDLVNEYRVHSFLGRSIRAGRKIQRVGFDNPHPWIRSWDGGWFISYDGASIRQRHRDIAHQAVAALGLQFGAVDIGEKADGSLIVLEVNRAPGIEGGSIEAYANAVRQWAS